jgi:dienelactone hydrolase
VTSARPAPAAGVLQTSEDSEARNLGYLDSLRDWLRSEIVDGYAERRVRDWHWDHGDLASYGHSVADRREAWRRVLNPPDLARTGPVQTGPAAVPDGLWIRVPVHEHLAAEGLLVVPPGARRLVVFQHGLGSSPERVFGLPDADNGYRGVGRQLVDRGWAVLAPMNLTQVGPRNRAQDLARLAGTTMEGIELTRCRVLLDAIAELSPRLDTDAAAMVGISWGGMAAQYWTPLEDRFVVAASIAFFNDRRTKMAVQDNRYITFADRGEHHAFLPGQLGTFSDAELASLICPRPFLVQHGELDRIAWAPQVEAEFDRSRRHWDLLGVGDRTELHLHPGGHEVEPERLLAWLTRHHPPRQ